MNRIIIISSSISICHILHRYKSLFSIIALWTLPIAVSTSLIIVNASEICVDKLCSMHYALPRMTDIYAYSAIYPIHGGTNHVTNHGLIDRRD